MGCLPCKANRSRSCVEAVSKSCVVVRVKKLCQGHVLSSMSRNCVKVMCCLPCKENRSRSCVEAVVCVSMSLLSLSSCRFCRATRPNLSCNWSKVR